MSVNGCPQGSHGIMLLIYSDDIANYTKHIEEVLYCLQKVILYVKAKKCEFHSKLVEYLRYILFSFKLIIADNKIKIIQNWPKLRKVKDIQSFLGFANFYHRFIYRYSDIVVLLTHLIWNFDNSYHEAFNILKKVFITTLIFLY